MASGGGRALMPLFLLFGGKGGVVGGGARLTSVFGSPGRSLRVEGGRAGCGRCFSSLSGFLSIGKGNFIRVIWPCF